MFVAGSMVKWLRDGLGWIGHADETEALAVGPTTMAGSRWSPHSPGSARPTGEPEPRAAISGLTLGTRREQIVRAALESIAHQCSDLQSAFAADGADWQLAADRRRHDRATSWLAQDLADILGLPVERPA